VRSSTLIELLLVGDVIVFALLVDLGTPLITIRQSPLTCRSVKDPKPADTAEPL
jgi:hypothetical protein